MVGMAAQAVGDGICHTCLVIYPTGNLEGRYRRGGENADDYARGPRQWTAPWGNHGGNDFINIFPHGQYCLKSVASTTTSPPSSSTSIGTGC